MQRSWSVLAGLVSGCLLMPQAGWAQYSNGPVPDLTDAWEMSGFHLAQGFTLDQPWTITSVFIPTTYQGGGVVDPNWGFRGFFQWTLFTDDGHGHPGSVFASGTSIPTFGNRTVRTPDYDEADASFDITPTALAANTQYWLSVLNTDSTGSLQRVGLYWRAGGDTTVPPLEYWDPRLGQWVSGNVIDAWYNGYGNRLAMSLRGELTQPTTTPEPTALMLLAAGLGGLGVVCRRRLP